MTLETLPIDDGRCAVVDCVERGRPQVCLTDGRYHRHGYIHYEDGDGGLVFRRGAWHWLCDAHYRQIAVAARKEPTR